jgi:hypothetical protein
VNYRGISYTIKIAPDHQWAWEIQTPKPGTGTRGSRLQAELAAKHAIDLYCKRRSSLRVVRAADSREVAEAPVTDAKLF